MIPFKFDYAIEQINNNRPDIERSLLQIYTDQRISPREADDLLRKVADHKWFVSERLNRDVGFHVAAIDYVENFYTPQQSSRTVTKAKEALLSAFAKLGSVIKTTLTANGGLMPM